MAELTLAVRNPSGLHARPAAEFVRLAASFAADVRLANVSRDAGAWADAKSILDVLSLGVSAGNEIRVRAEGPDAEHALQALSELVASELGESGGPILAADTVRDVGRSEV